MTHPLRSTDITPLPRDYEGGPPLDAASVLSSSWFLPLVTSPFTSASRFPRSIQPPLPGSAQLYACMPDATPSVSRLRRSLSHDLLTTVVLTSSDYFRHEIGGSLAVLFLEVT